MTVVCGDFDHKNVSLLLINACHQGYVCCQNTRGFKVGL